MSSYVCLAASLFATGALFDIALAHYLGYVCLGLYAYSRWYIPRALANIDTSRRIDSHAFLGDEVEVKLGITNTGRLTIPWLSVWDSTPLELGRASGTMKVLSLAGKHGTSIVYHIKPRRRGYYRLGPMYLATSDLFGLFDQRQTQRPVSHITVYPRVTELGELGLPSRLPFGSVVSHQKIFDDPTRPIGIREYRTGDSQRRIHWKASGHLGRLTVKTFEPAVSLETAVLLNLNRSDFNETHWRDGTEFGIEVAASLSVHLANRKQPIGLFTNGLDPLGTQTAPSFDPSSGRLQSEALGHARGFTAIAPRAGRAQLMRILESLARIQAADSATFPGWALEACTRLGWGVTVIAVTPTGDEPTCRALHQLARTGFNPILVVTQPVYFAPVRQRADQLGFRAYRAANRRDLDDLGQRRA